MKKVQTAKHPLLLWGQSFEPGALAQLENLANMPYIFRHVAAMPDAHVGIGATIGSVFASKNAVVPSAVGVDIGCGMRAIRTGIEAKSVLTNKLHTFVDMVYSRIPLGFKSHGSERRWKGLNEFPLESRELRKKAALQIGTLGGGNHFIELQTDGEALWLMIHTGSRHIGLQIAEKYIRKAKDYNSRHNMGLPPDLSYLPINENIGREYLNAMTWALNYAKENRKQLMDQLLDIFRVTVTSQFDVYEDIEIHHNFAKFEKHFDRDVLVHRKGATRAYENEYGIIPGSMGTPSYITRGKGNPESFMSSSHGAGRVMGRRQAKKRLSMNDLDKAMKGVVANINKSMLDEAPQAYKRIEDVMEAQKDLVDVVYKLTPLASVKG